MLEGIRVGFKPSLFKFELMLGLNESKTSSIQTSLSLKVQYFLV